MKNKKLTKVLISMLTTALCLGNVPMTYASDFSSGEGMSVADVITEDAEAIFSDSSQEVENAAADAEIVMEPEVTDDVETEENSAVEIFGTEPIEEINEAQEVTEKEFLFVNPLYEDVITVDDLIRLEDTGTVADMPLITEDGGVSLFSSEAVRTQTASVVTCDTIEEAGILLRECMLDRETTLQYVFETTEELEAADVFDMMDYAVAHTGVPIEGDYLKYQYAGFDVRLVGTSDSYTMTWTLTYYTSPEQENIMDEAVAGLLGNLRLEGKTDYEKISAIYDYICSNVTYDYANLNNDEYDLKYTGYAALVNKTAVCQGYAVLMYRLLLASGVDCRIVAGQSYGENHSWNIVELGDKYYDVDATWDAGYLTYKYFLKCEANFTDHIREDEYMTESFWTQYPMGSTDYVVQDSDISTAVQYLEKDVFYSIINGKATVIDYQGQAEKVVIPDIVNGATVSAVGSYAFYDCETVKMIEFAGNAPVIDELAFYGTDIIAVYPYGNTTWTDNMLQDYSGTVEWVAHGENIHTWIENTAASVKVTCESDGKNVWNCQVCDKEKSEVLSATGHSWSEWATTKEASYKADGLKERVCANCEEKETETIAKKVIAAPTTTLKELAYNQIQLSWNTVEGAEGYRIYRRAAGGSWTRLKLVSSTEVSYIDATVKPGVKYCYRVRAYCKADGKTLWGKYKTTQGLATKTAAPVLGSTKSVAYNKIRISWSAVDGATGYRIYRKTAGGSWQLLKNMAATRRSYTDATVETGVTYYYTVRSYCRANGKIMLGRYNSSGIKGAAKPAAPKLVSASILSSSKTQIVWKAAEGVTGYRIYRKLSNGNWKLIDTVGASVTSYTYTKAYGKSYTYTVRGYREVNGKTIMGAYSSAGIKSK